MDKPYARWQSLYTANTISAAGKVTGLALRYGADLASAVTCTGVTLKLGHTNATDLSTTFSSNIGTGQGSQSTVLANASITFPAAATGAWQTISFTTPFDYNGRDNLLVEFELPYACSGSFPEAFDNAAGLVTVWTFASGSPTGGTNTFTPNVRLTFAGGDDAVEFGGVSNANIFGPLYRNMMLYLASDITGTGPITGIGMQVNATTVAGTYTYTLKLGHTTVSALTATFADNYNAGGASTIVTNGTFTIPAGIPTGDYVWIPFPGSFTYNGTDNLIVDFDLSSASATNNMRYTSGSGGGSARIAGGTTGSSVANIGIAGSRVNMIFRFNGGKMLVGLGAGSNSGQALGSGSAGQIQSLYSNTMLGTSGTINAVYLRLFSGTTPTSASLTNYKLYMGHTTKNILSVADTYASNMDENAAVFTGTLTVPAGLKAGDWVKIPLSSPFAYDVRKNLSILFATDAGPIDNRVSVTAYTTVLSVGRNDNNVLTPTWTYPGILDLAVDISK